jgi:hypothetical protein
MTNWRVTMAPDAANASTLVDADVEEARLWEYAEQRLQLAPSGPYRVDSRIKHGETRRRLRSLLESTIATGSWPRQERFVRAYLRTGVSMAVLLMEREPRRFGRKIDERLVSLATGLVESTHRVVRARVVEEHRAQHRANRLANAGPSS